MNKKTTGIIAYITWIGWIVAFCAGDKEGAKFHLNQALVILIGQIVAAVINYIPYVGGIVGTIQIIITFLHGEQPEDVNLTTAEETAAASAAE